MVWPYSFSLGLVPDFFCDKHKCCLHHFFFRYEFKTNHEEWVRSVKPRLGRGVFDHVIAAVNTTPDNIKGLYKVKNEMRGAFQNLLKVI